MYAYIQNGAIACISHESLEIPDTEKREYNDHISNPILVDGEIVEYRDEECEKKERIQASLISSPHLETVDLEGVQFTNQDIGDIILERVFGGNPHAESALQAKISSYIISVISGEPNTELLTEIEDKQKGVNEVRNKFGLLSLVA